MKDCECCTLVVCDDFIGVIGLIGGLPSGPWYGLYLPILLWEWLAF